MNNLLAARFILGASVFLATIPATQAAEGTSGNCEEFAQRLQLAIPETRDESFHFTQNAEDLGWQIWSDQLHAEIGFPAAAGYSGMPTLADVPMNISEKYRYDYLVWQPIEINGDNIQDRIVITSFLSGNKGRYHYGHDIFLFCGKSANSNSAERFRPCGNWGYWASTVRVGRVETMVATDQLYTLVRGPETSFSLIEIDDIQYLLATARGWVSDTDFTYAADLWSLNTEKPTRHQSCDWSN